MKLASCSTSGLTSATVDVATMMAETPATISDVITFSLRNIFCPAISRAAHQSLDALRANATGSRETIPGSVVDSSAMSSDLNEIVEWLIGMLVLPRLHAGWLK